MDSIKKKGKKRQKEYDEILSDIVPPFEPLTPKKAKKRKPSLTG